MAGRVLIAIPDDALAAQAHALIEEGGELAVVDRARNVAGVIETLSTLDVDALILHESFGPLPVVEVARDLAMRFPHVGIVLAVRDRTPEILRAALQAGVRDVVATPLSLEELSGGLLGAVAWARVVKDRISIEAGEAPVAVGGVMVAVAGAKGGVGTTTLATHLALHVARSVRTKSISLVDFDLQAGDVATLLDLGRRRTVMDLLELADEISARHLEDTMFVHPSGLRALLSASEGEHAEDLGATAARRILGAIKSYYDVVVVDVGSTVTEANAVAVEMADHVVVVTTPDVPSMRAANRLLALWERLQVRKEDVRALVNRADRDLEVQPELVKKVVDAPLLETAIPAAFKSLEPAVNTGAPERLVDGAMRNALARLAVEMELAPFKKAAR